ncbi:phosphoglucomutase/phosphomannomutase family protein [Rhodohalobacter sp. 614A]|uniref:phosphoglucomutase/phosphomannomutase family protein n=1 Tax=Rhodohalobacter sp. 614A TaxID=2908649 RepID=UPI001F1C01FE|nr:phosphoglucomutase/phosphomannomutase family protein [Rhodohalobacter sp. 614A]
MNHIKFGTDGWRGIIAENYTFENVGIVTQAVARWIGDEEVTENGVVIGYDARFLSERFAKHAAVIFAAMEIPVRISNQIVPTPAVSWAANHFDAVGVVVTASHNPPEYNGYKIKAPFGGSANPDQIAGIEQRLDLYDITLSAKPYVECVREGLIREMNFTDGYLDLIRELIDLEAIKQNGIKIAHDPMYGSGRTILKQLLGEQVLEIHDELNPLFGGIAPEPMGQNLDELSHFIAENNCALGIANDGDADRIGMVDENGTFVSSHKLLSLLVEYLHQEKKMNGKIVKTFSTTNMLDKQAEKYGLTMDVTPIGFKYIAEKIVNEDILAGGEESGGIAVKGHLPERDGIYIGLLITEMVVKSGKTLGRLIQDLFDEYGKHSYYRNDIHTEDHKKKAMIQYCEEKKLNTIAGLKVVDWNMKDGIKHLLENGSWLLVRPSGTEPVLRIYAEASDYESAVALVEDATSWVDRPEILV